MAEALVGGAFLSAFLQVLFDRMASRKFLDVFRQQKLSEELLRKLRIALLSVNAVIEDAEEKELTNPAVKMWLDELKNAAYNTEDILDEIATKVLQGTQVQTYALEKAIKDVLDTLEFIAKQKDVIGLKEGVGARPLRRLPTTAFVEVSNIFGRDDDKEKIINLLCSDDASDEENMRVIAIVGTGGIGKTTLAQLVVNSNVVTDYFDHMAWVSVSQEFDVLKITKTIIENVTMRSYALDDLNLLQIKLSEKLDGRIFLIVLDDVWNEIYDYWELLSNCFQYGAKGSAVIVTTRNENVALTMLASETHYLKELNDEHCWALFARYAFRDGESNSYPELEKIGRQIVGKCKGLPLAAKTIGALLWSKRDAAEWDQILKSELWDLPNNGRNILSALRLSYTYLPSHLKQCFAYCSIFPKGHIFEKDQLILLWMAEGFLPQSINKTMEEVGNEYFHDLVSRSLFQPLSGTGLRFVMHHLINDLATFVYGQLGFRLEGDYSNQNVHRTRHLSYLRTRFDEKFEALYKAKQLRTFLLLASSSSDVYSTKKVSHNLLSMLTCLRVLSFSNCSNIIELSDSIGKIIHLRYLDLSSTGIKRLPDSICELCNLQTLKLSSCAELVELPTNVHKLISLRHLDLSFNLLLQCLPDSICELNGLQTLKLAGCTKLIALPREIKKLTNLRHLDIISTGIRVMPIQLGRLKRLRMLTAFIVSEDTESIQELGQLVNLRGELSILKLQNLQLSIVEAVLKDMSYLEKLVLEWNDSNTSRSESQRNEKMVLDSLKPHTNLKSLVIKCYGAELFSDWVWDPSFSNIVSLCLENCKYCHTLPSLGQLPSLQSLSVIGFEGVVKVDREFYGSESSSFRALKVLRFKQMLKWEEWFSFGAENEGEVFSKLEELYTEDCPKLIGVLPVNLPCLAKLVINKCPQLVASLSSAPTGCEMQLIKCNEALLNDLPSGIRLFVVKGYNAIQSLPEGIMEPNSLLQELRISDCSSLMHLSGGDLPSTLKAITVEYCEKLELPTHLNYSFLEKLHLTDSCDSLTSFQLQVFPGLYEIKIRGCRNLESLTVQHEDDLAVVQIEIRDCPNFVSFPQEGLRAPNLTNFRVANCERLKSLPDNMCILLPSLQSLSIENCPEIECLPEGGLPPSPNSDSIHIKGCKKLGA